VALPHGSYPFAGASYSATPQRHPPSWQPYRLEMNAAGARAPPPAGIRITIRPRSARPAGNNII